MTPIVRMSPKWTGIKQFYYKMWFKHILQLMYKTINFTGVYNNKFYNKMFVIHFLSVPGGYKQFPTFQTGPILYAYFEGNSVGLS